MTSKPAAPGPREALVEPCPEQRRASRGEQDRDPAVGDLGGQGDVLRPHGREVDGNVGPAVEDRLERLAEPRRVRPRVRDLVVLAAVLERLLTPEDRADDLDVLPGALERLAEGLAVPALDDLGPRDAQPEAEPPAGERVQGHRRRRGRRRRASRHLHDPGPDVDPRRPGSDEGGRRHGVGAVRLGRPDRVVAEALELEDLLDVEGHPGARVLEGERELHPHPPRIRVVRRRAHR